MRLSDRDVDGLLEDLVNIGIGTSVDGEDTDDAIDEVKGEIQRRIAELEAALSTAVEQRREALEILHDTYGDSPDLVTAARDVWSAFVRLHREKEAAVAERQAAERVADAGSALYGELAVIYRRLKRLSDERSLETAATLDGLLRAYETAAAPTGQASEGAG